MRTPEKDDINDSGKMNGNAPNDGHIKRTVADFPINENLLLDEVANTTPKGYKHIQLEADESVQHPETRTGQKENEETLLDEVAKKDPTAYPDIE